MAGTASWPLAQPPAHSNRLPQDRHAAAVPTESLPGPQHPAVDLQAQQQLRSMQQPVSAGLAAAAAASTANDTQQMPLSERLTVEVPAAPHSTDYAGPPAAGVAPRPAVRSPDGQQWLDPLQTVCLPCWCIPTAPCLRVVSSARGSSTKSKHCKPRAACCCKLHIDTRCCLSSMLIQQTARAAVRIIQAQKLVQRSGESAEELDRRDLYLQYRALEREYTLALAAEPGSAEEAAARRRCRQIVGSWRSCMMSRQQQGAVLTGAHPLLSDGTPYRPPSRCCLLCPCHYQKLSPKHCSLNMIHPLAEASQSHPVVNGRSDHSACAVRLC